MIDSKKSIFLKKEISTLGIKTKHQFFTVTVISTIIMVLLFISEVSDYLTPNIREELFVDTSRGSKLRINLDIVLPIISCDCKFIVAYYLSITSFKKFSLYLILLKLFSTIAGCYGYYWRAAFTHRP